MVEDIYVCEDRGWYVLVALVGDYLLAYFFLWSDVTPWRTRGYSVGSVDTNFCGRLLGILNNNMSRRPSPDIRVLNRCNTENVTTRFFQNKQV